MASQTVSVYDSKGSQVLPNMPVVIMNSEVHTANNEIVSQPLEDGSPMTDHIIIQSNTLDLSFIVTNVDGVHNPLEGERAKTAWQELKRMRNNRERFTVVTRHEIYENMAIEGLTGSHEAPYRGQLKYDVKLKKIDITNFNVGKNPQSKFTKSSPDNVINSTSKEVNKDYSIAASATDLASKGIVGVILGSQFPEFAETAFGKWMTQNFSAANLLATAKQAANTTSLEQAALLAQTNLFSSMTFVDIGGVTPAKFQSLVGDSYLTFENKFNYQDDCWTLNVGDLDQDIIVAGLTLAPGLNLLEGYNFDLPIENLFVIDMKNGGANGTNCFGNGVSNSTNVGAALAYFDDDLLEAFKDAVDDLAGTRDLNFSLTDMDYEVSA